MDDEPQIERVPKTTLQSQSYEVKTPADGETALNRSVDWIPDLAVTDLSMALMPDECWVKRLASMPKVT